MLGERSSKTIVVSARPPAVSPSQPLANGRLTARISPATTSMRDNKISHWRSFAYPRDIRLAASRNIMAAHRVVWKRRWLIR